MNLTNLAASLREDITTIQVYFTTREGGITRDKAYTYKCPLSIANKLSKGDLVVVHAENNSNYRHTTIAEVASVNEEPDIDLEDRKVLKWVMCAIPVEATLEKQKVDEEVGKRLRAKQAQNCRERALQVLGLSSEEAKKLLEAQLE